MEPDKRFKLDVNGFVNRAMSMKNKGLRQVIPNTDMINYIMLQTLVESNWTFSDTMNFISTQSIEIAHDLSRMLAERNEPWQRWFAMDFPTQIRELGPDIPTWFLAQNTKQYLHPNDRIYVKVPWRRYYIWSRFFRRRCAFVLCFVRWYASTYINKEKSRIIWIDIAGHEDNDINVRYSKIYNRTKNGVKRKEYARFELHVNVTQPMSVFMTLFSVLCEYKDGEAAYKRAADELLIPFMVSFFDVYFKWYIFTVTKRNVYQGIRKPNDVWMARQYPFDEELSQLPLAPRVVDESDPQYGKVFLGCTTCNDVATGIDESNHLPFCGIMCQTKYYHKGGV